jgi:hypothetical protein
MGSIQSKKGNKGIKIAPVWMRARLGRANAQPTVDYPCDRIIPLEPLAAATEVVYVDALGRIEIVLKFTPASRTVHGGISLTVSMGIPLLFPLGTNMIYHF